MIEIILIACLSIATILLIILSIIDLRIGLLPNVHNAALAVIGIIFHGLSGFEYITPTDMALGAAMGGGLLWGIRFVGNRYYGEDSLGLGDVKLLAAAGLWLGPEHVMMALVIGALAGLVHGAIMIGCNWLKTREVGSLIDSLATFSLPAGPGFCVGIFCAGLAKFWPFIQTALL